MGVDLPFPFTAKDPKELIQQALKMFEDLYQERIGGAQLGDVFTIGDDEVLTVGLSSTGGLEKVSSALAVKKKSTGGILSDANGTYIYCKTGGGLSTDATGLYISAAGGSNFATINCPAGTDPVAEIVGDTLNLTATGLTITGNSTTDTVDFAITDEAVTNAKLAHMAVNTIKGRITAGTGDPEDLTGANVRTIAGLAPTDSPELVTVKLTGLTDGYIPKHTADATGLENSVLYQDAASRIIAGGTTIPANDMIGLNLMNHAKGQLINAVYGIVDPANVRLFLIFDQTGAVSTITDRSTIGGTTAHVTTLRDGSLNAINASTMTPGVSGLSPYLTFNATHLWDTPDAADLTFGTGTADLAFSVVALVNPVDATSSTFAAKWDETTGSEKREWRFYMASTDKLFFVCYDESANAYIGRLYNTAITGDQGTWHTYIGTKSTAVTSAAIKIYRDGAPVDDTNYQNGTYAAMEDLGALVGAYQTSTAGAAAFTAKYQGGILLVVAETLTAVQAAMLDVVLRGCGGVTY